MNQRVYFRQQAIAHLKACLTVCLAVLFCCSSFAAPAWANEPVSNFGVTPRPALDSNYTDVVFANPCGETDFVACPLMGIPVPPGDSINVNFGAGDDIVLQNIDIGGDIFLPAATALPATGGLASRVVFRRNPNPIPGVPAGGRSQLFFSYTGPEQGVASPLNINPQEATTLEEGMLSLTINRGIDNVFNNDTVNGGANIEETRNNIERIDYIIDGGLEVPVADRENFGFLIMDRGGNDPFKIALILGLDGAGDPNLYGPLREQNVPWSVGGAATSISTVVTRDDDPGVPPAPGEPTFRPSHTVGPQDVRGRFFRVSTLTPVGNNTTTRIFGYSIFPGDDEIDNANALDFANFPANTDGNDGGLDLMAGGAVFARLPDPQIGLAKTNSAPRPVAGQAGFFDFDLEFTVANTGNTTLTDVQITEDLEASYITGATNRADAFNIVGTPTINAAGVTGTAPTPNPAYDGTAANPNLFAAGNVFNVGDTATVTITVRVDVGTNIGGAPPLGDGILVATNQATATGNPPAGPPVTDLSQNGRDVDPDGDNNPGNNSEPTPIQIPFPSVGVAKSVSLFRPVPGTTQFDVDFTISVINSGATVLDNVTLQENLQQALITNAINRADSFTVLSPPTLTTTGFTGTPPTINAAYDGVGNVQLLNTPNSFNPGDTATVVVPVRLELGSGGPGPLNDGVLNAQNTSVAAGTPSGPGVPPGTGPVTDRSQVGTNADPDNDGNPGNNNDPTPIQFPSTTAQVVLVKRITNIFRGGAALSVPGITNFNDQPGDNNDSALNAALGGGNRLAGIFQLPPGLALDPNDEVEYTIYLWNNSGGQITQFNICDELQPPSVLNTTVGFELDSVGPLGPPTFGNAGGAVAGRSPGAPLDAFCPSAATATSFPIGPPGPTGGLGVGAGGGVVAGPFTVPANQFGAFRFRVRIP